MDMKKWLKAIDKLPENEFAVPYENQVRAMVRMANEKGRELDVRDIYIITRLFGLDGVPATSPEQLAKLDHGAIGISADRIRTLATRSIHKICLPSTYTVNQTITRDAQHKKVPYNGKAE